MTAIQDFDVSPHYTFWQNNLMNIIIQNPDMVGSMKHDQLG